MPTHFTDPPLKITEKGDVAHGQEWFPLCERFAIHRTNIIKTDCSGIFTLWDREEEIPVGYIGASVFPELISDPKPTTPRFSNNPFASLNFNLKSVYTSEYSNYIASRDSAAFNFEGIRADDLLIWMMEFDPAFLKNFHELSISVEGDVPLTLRDILMGVYSLLVTDFGFTTPEYRAMRWSSVANLNIQTVKYRDAIQLNPGFKEPTVELMNSLGSSDFIFPCITSLAEDIYFVNDISADETALYAFNFLNVYDKDMAPIGRIGYAFLDGINYTTNGSTYHKERICKQLPKYMNRRVLDAIRSIEEECTEAETTCLAIWSIEIAEDYSKDKDVLCSRIIQAIQEKHCDNFNLVKLVLDEDKENYLVSSVPAPAPLMKQKAAHLTPYIPEDILAIMPLESTVIELENVTYNGRLGYISVIRRFDLSSGDVRVYEAMFYDLETGDVQELGMFSAYIGFSDGIYPQYCDFKGRIDMVYASTLGKIIDSMSPEPEATAILWMVQLSRTDAETVRYMKGLIAATMDGEECAGEFLCSKSPCVYLFNDSLVPAGFYIVSPASFLGHTFPGDMGSSNETYMKDAPEFHENVGCGNGRKSNASRKGVETPDCRHFARVSHLSAAGKITIENVLQHLKAEHSAVLKVSINDSLMGYVGVSVFRKGCTVEPLTDWVTSELFDPLENSTFVRAYANAAKAAEKGRAQGTGFVWHVEFNPKFMGSQAIRKEIMPLLIDMMAEFMGIDADNTQGISFQGLTGFQFAKGFIECPAHEVLSYFSLP